MHPVRGLLVVAGLTIATAAAGAPSGEPGRVSFTGFSLVPPEGTQWVIKSDTPHPSIQALFIRDVGEERKRLSLEKHHSFVVMTTADVIPDLPYEDADKLLKRITEDIKGSWQPGKLKSISVSISPGAADYAQGPFCVDYQLTGNDEDRISGQPGKFFVMILRGKRCLHLYHPAYVVDLSYSQRSYHGTWITAFDKEVERFFNDLEFMPMPLWPYVAEQLENYSYALLKVDNQAEARTVKTHAERLKEAATGEGGYLGFDPAADLETYALFLRSRGDLRGAQKMTILAKKWSDNNLLSFLMLQSKENNQ